MTNYNDGNWHGWNGGECPVHPETVVEVALYDETDETNPVGSWSGRMQPRAGELGETWENLIDYRNIIAFRVVKEYREARDFWIKDGVSFLYHVDGAIHVREVIE